MTVTSQKLNSFAYNLRQLKKENSANNKRTQLLLKYRGKYTPF